jgi:hypothetical protein
LGRCSVTLEKLSASVPAPFICTFVPSVACQHLLRHRTGMILILQAFTLLSES